MKDVLANRLKGYACLLVLIGHVLTGLETSAIGIPTFLTGLERIIHSYHIDLFMFLSGYVYGITGTWKKKGSVPSFLGNKLLNLGVPYFVFSVIYIVINTLTPGANNQNSFSDIPKVFYDPIAQYWFLYALFFVFVLWVIISLVANKFVTLGILYAVYIAVRLIGINLGPLYLPLCCVLPFGLGVCMPTLSTKKIPAVLKIGTVILHITLGIVFFIFDLMGRVFLDDILTILGIASSVFFITMLTRLEKIGKALDFVCKYSLQIYLLHTVFTAATRIILIKIGMTFLPLHIILGLIAGFVFPVGIAFVASKTPYLDFFFHPSYAIMEIKKRKAK